MRRDAQRLKEELEALQCMRCLSEQAEELERAATREEAATATEEREARVARRDKPRQAAELGRHVRRTCRLRWRVQPRQLDVPGQLMSSRRRR
jgi:predicted NAD-dependent protein-ADP-ribosyltransferase YbiA (DUF1768 family)